MTSAPPIERTAGAPLFSNNKLSVLRKHPYFADLEPEAFDQLCRYAKHITLKRGTAIFSKGDPGTSLIAVDESDVFAPYLPYLTWDPRLVAGSVGLVPRSWHPAMEAWGGTQFQNRFERLANRPIREEDYQAWLALRIVGEAATRTQSADPATLREFILSDQFDVAGFKGQKLTVRDWDHQVRQPILLTTGVLTTSVSPQDQYLHQTSALDTLGIDRPETECSF